MLPEISSLQFGLVPIGPAKVRQPLLSAPLNALPNMQRVRLDNVQPINYRHYQHGFMHGMNSALLHAKISSSSQMTMTSTNNEPRITIDLKDVLEEMRNMDQFPLDSCDPFMVESPQSWR